MVEAENEFNGESLVSQLWLSFLKLNTYKEQKIYVGLNINYRQDTDSLLVRTLLINELKKLVKKNIKQQIVYKKFNQENLSFVTIRGQHQLNTAEASIARVVFSQENESIIRKNSMLDCLFLVYECLENSAEMPNVLEHIRELQYFNVKL